MEIYSVDNAHTITCVLSEVYSKVTVMWTTAELDPLTNIEQGEHSDTTQTSKLELSTDQIKALKAANDQDPAHVITCKITVGSTSTDYTATQTVNIYTPGNFIY